MNRVVGILGILAAAAALVALLWPLLKHRAIYPGGTLPEAMSHPSKHGLTGAEEVWLVTEDDVRIHAWWTPARSGEDGAVIYCHGNAESMATRAWIADRLSRRGFHVLLFDYRGYGLSQGRASEEGMARDARAAWRHVVDQRGVAPARVVLMGHSLGSAVATRLALEVQAGKVGGPAGLVVGSPFPDMPSLFQHHAPWLPPFMRPRRKNRLDAGSKLGEVDAPVLVVIGTEDRTIPPEISRSVHRAAREMAERTEPIPLVAAPTDHARLMGHVEVWAALDTFLAGALPQRH